MAKLNLPITPGASMPPTDDLTSTRLRPTDTVRLLNVGEEPWEGKYAGARYPIAPGSEAMVPFAAVCLWFGHPDAVDIDAKNKHRTEELNRVRVRYGVYEQEQEPPFLDDERLKPNPRAGQSTWETRVPKVRVVTLAGDDLAMVIHDPHGDRVTPAAQSVAQQDRDRMELESLRSRLAALEARDDKARLGQVATSSGDASTDAAAASAAANTRTGATSTADRPEVAPTGGDGPDATEDKPTRVRAR